MSDKNRAIVAVGQRGVVASVTRQVTITEKLISRIQALQAIPDVFYVPQDGSIEEGISRVRPGGLISIGEGRFILDTPVVITKPLRIKGAGKKLTIIASSASEAAVLVNTDGLFHMEHVGIIKTGIQPGILISLASHEVILRSCAFTGNLIGSPGSEYYGKYIDLRHSSKNDQAWSKKLTDGVQVKSNTTGVIENIVVTHCARGICIEDSVKMQLRCNRCVNNSSDGIIFQSSSTGTAENNICFGNGSTGISVEDQSNVQLIGNRCEKNLVGISIYTSNSCTAENNICNRNSGHRKIISCGIFVAGQSKVNLIGNRCEDNGDFGIIFMDSFTGTAENNICIGNGSSGIDVQGQSNVDLSGNRCEENLLGISFSGSSTGTAKDNICCRNKSKGIDVSSQSEVNLIGNRCEDNLGSGISFKDLASGTAESNICSQNGTLSCIGGRVFSGGIVISSKAHVSLTSNYCVENHGFGIMFYDSTAIIVKNNICSRNELSGICVVDNQSKACLTDNLCEDNHSNNDICFATTQK